jgi:hypothetical protein
MFVNRVGSHDSLVCGEFVSANGSYLECSLVEDRLYTTNSVFKIDLTAYFCLPPAPQVKPFILAVWRKSCYNWRLVSQTWCRAPLGAQDLILSVASDSFIVKKSCGVLSDKRAGLSNALLFVKDIHIYILKYIYIYRIQIQCMSFLFAGYTRPLSLQAVFTRLCIILN